jgi:hypothetical protein
MGFRNFAKRSGLVDARVGKENIDPAFLDFDRLVEPLEVSEISDIALHTGYVGANLGDRPVKLRLTATGDKDIRAAVMSANNPFRTSFSRCNHATEQQKEPFA